MELAFAFILFLKNEWEKGRGIGITRATTVMSGEQSSQARQRMQIFQLYYIIRRIVLHNCKLVRNDRFDGDGIRFARWQHY